MAIVASLFVGIVLGWMGREVVVAFDHRDEDRRWLRWSPTEKELK